MVARCAPSQCGAGQEMEACLVIRTLPEFLLSLTLPCCFTGIWSQPWRPPRSTSWGRALLLTLWAERSCYHHKTNCAQCLAVPIFAWCCSSVRVVLGKAGLPGCWSLGAASPPLHQGLLLPSSLIKPSGPEASHTEGKIKLFPSGSLSAQELGRAQCTFVMAGF